MSSSKIFSEKSKNKCWLKGMTNIDNYRMSSSKIFSNHNSMDGDKKIFVLNPISGRYIRVGGITYKGLVREGKLKHPESDKKIYNSTTNRFINIGGATYKKAVKRGE